MGEFTGDYYKCNKCGHIWDYMDVCPECGKDDVVTLNVREVNEHIKRLTKMLKSHGDSCNVVSVSKVRKAFAEYYKTEGCSCCRDIDGHNKAEKKLAKLLKPDEYDDKSGFDWYKYATK